MKKTHFAFLVGDLSGDAQLASLLPLIPGDHYGVGGPCIAHLGYELLGSTTDLDVNGWGISSSRLQHILKIVQKWKETVLLRGTQFVVLVDYGFLNLKLARWAYENGLTVFFHIPPKFWAHHSNKAFLLKKYTHFRSVIYPFEKPAFEKLGIDVQFLGHPLAVFRDHHASNHHLLIAPGSRQKEILFQLPILLEAAHIWIKDHPNWTIHLSVPHPTRERLMRDLYQDFQTRTPSPHLDQTLTWHPGLIPSTPIHFAWCSMGTAAFELSCAQIPHISLYKTDWLSAQIAKRTVKTPFFHLTNLCLQKPVVPEILQTQLTPTYLVKETQLRLNTLHTQIQGFQELSSLFPAQARERLATWFNQQLERGPLW